MDKDTLISVGILIEQRARIFESVRGASLDDSHAQLCADALRNVLDEIGIRDDVLDVFARRAQNAAGEADATVGIASLERVVWHSRIADAAALAEREESSADRPASWPGADRPPEQLSLGSDDAWPGEDRMTAQPEPDAWPGEATLEPRISDLLEYKSPEESQADRAEADADAGTLGEW